MAQKDYTPEQIKSESAKVNAFFEKSFQGQLDRSPMFKTYLGIHEDYDKLDDISDEFEETKMEITKKELKELHSFDFESLDEPTRLSYRVFEYLAETEIEGFKFRFHDYPANQLSGLHSELPSMMINMHQVANTKELQDYISRLNRFSFVFDQLLVLMKTREKKGIIPPQFVYPQTIDNCRSMIKGQPFDKSKQESPLWEDFDKKLKSLKGLTKAERKKFQDQAQEALLNSVKPAYEKTIAYLTDLEKRAPENGGAFYLPDSKALYKFRLKRNTSTEMTPDEIHELGLKHVARIHEEMKEIMNQVKFKGDLQGFFKFLKTSKQFYFKNDKAGKKAYLAKSTEIIDNMRKQLKKFFNTFPKAEIVVKAVEPFREKTTAGAFYEGPSEDGKRPGTYYVSLYDTESQPIYEMEALAYHEAIPGHHMQVAIAQELQNVPKFRKYNWQTAYGEGWALYTEQLPKEFGFYKDPYSDFGRLSMELLRAARLVVDTGIHAKGWTREQAIDYFNTNTPGDTEGNRREVERYIVWPGQATAYMIGKLKILELRDLAKKSLGKKFDIREFHDQVLKDGGLPLKLLEENIQKWIKVKSA